MCSQDEIACFCPKYRRTGFSLTELLVVIAVIGVLAALLLPAVQMAREAARRMQCSNNLKQVALALHNYHDVHGLIPPDYIDMPYRPEAWNWTWAALVLPFIEQQPLHASLDFIGQPVDDHNLALLATPLPVFRCPSDISPRLESLIEFSTFKLATVPNDSYALNESIHGAFTFWEPERPRFRFSDVTDGLSNTLLLAETTLGSFDLFGVRLRSSTTWSTTLIAAGDWPNEYYFFSTVICWGVASPKEKITWFDPCSYHPGGAQFAMFDGSVRFLSATGGNSKTVYALSTPSGGEPIGSF
jgi:prepilin-type N-terminal cleavage/methylation domain-containing protein/prepilin-type processing-associated H-X9-DG protein